MECQFGQFPGSALKGRQQVLLFPFYPVVRNPGLVGRSGAVILEHKVTLEVEATQAEQQDRRSLGSEHGDVHTSPGQLDSEAENKHLSYLNHPYFGLTVTPG